MDPLGNNIAKRRNINMDAGGTRPYVLLFRGTSVPALIDAIPAVYVGMEYDELGVAKTPHSALNPKLNSVKL